MGATRNVNFANFVCRFGDKHVMLDLIEEVVIPAFLEVGERKFGDSRFFFQASEIANFGSLDNPELVIVGRLIHDTVLSRDQFLIDGKIVKDHASMPSAPSALFALVLDTHKLLYLPETRHAPNLAAFRATIHRFIRDKHKAFIDRQLKSLLGKDSKITRKTLLENYPYPTVEVVPLSSDASLEQFLAQFKVLKQVRIDLVDPNDELDGSSLIDKMRATKEALGAKATSLVYRNNGGLSQPRTVEELAPIIAEGNAKVSLVGEDAIGDRLAGNNEEFKMGVPLAEISTDPREAGRELYAIFREKVDAGLLKVKAASEHARNKVRQIATRVG